MVDNSQPDDLTQSLFAGIARDVIYAASGYLASHGVITGDQTQGFIGAGFFFAMLVFNSIRRAIRNAKIKEVTQ